MKNVFLRIFFCLIFLIPFFTKAQEAVIQNSDITFVFTEYNFGIIEEGSDGTCYFKFVNNSNVPLVISNVKTSCGCTVPYWPKQPIAPGDSNEIKIKYNTTRIGVFNKSITISSNSKNGNVSLNIKGEVIAKPKEILPENNNTFTMPEN